jgi:hypothetical protein
MYSEFGKLEARWHARVKRRAGVAHQVAAIAAPGGTLAALGGQGGYSQNTNRVHKWCRSGTIRARHQPQPTKRKSHRRGEIIGLAARGVAIGLTRRITCQSKDLERGNEQS